MRTGRIAAFVHRALGTCAGLRKSRFHFRLESSKRAVDGIGDAIWWVAALDVHAPQCRDQRSRERQKEVNNDI